MVGHSVGVRKLLGGMEKPHILNTYLPVWIGTKPGFPTVVPVCCRENRMHSVAVWLLSSVQFFCNPVDYSPLGSSVHGISQARILEWVAISFSRGSSPPRD